MLRQDGTTESCYVRRDGEPATCFPRQPAIALEAVVGIEPCAVACDDDAFRCHLCDQLVLKTYQDSKG